MRKQQIYTNFINNGHFEMNIYFIKKNAKISNGFLKRIF